MKKLLTDLRRLSIALATSWVLFPSVRADEPGPVVRLPAASTAEIEVGGHAADLLIQDLDADGFLDLVVAANDGGRDSPSFIFLSQGGKFSKPSWTSADASVSGGAALGDLDGDQDLDLVLVRYNHDRAAAYRNLGKGRFETEPFWESADTEWASAAFVGDFDGDGHADILAKGYADDHRIYLGAKYGLASEAAWRARKSEWAAAASAIVDVDGDGRRDLVTTSWIGPAYAVFRRREKLFEDEPSLVSKHLGEHGGLAVGDLDGDGFPEIAAGSRRHRQGDGRIRLYGNRKGAPTPDPIWMSDDVDADVGELIFHDLDRDGDLDLFVLSGSHTAVYASEKGTLAPTPCWRASIEGEVARIGDLDRDGHPDLLVGQRGSVHIFQGGAGALPPAVRPFPGMPRLAALPAKVEITEAFGLKLAPLTPALKEHYGLDLASGVIVLGAPPDVAWKLQIGNLREGDAIVGVGSYMDHGRHVEAVKDPSGLLARILEYGKEGQSRLVGLEWRCGPLHPGAIGEARPERFRLSKEQWAWLVTKLGDPVAEEPEVKLLGGAIIAMDAEGKEHREEDGSFTFVLWSGRSGTHQNVEVKKGHWSVQVPANVQLGITKVRLDGRAAHADRERIPVPEDGDLEIRVKWLASTSLRVLAADTRADLDGIEVVTGLDWRQDENAHPGAYDEAKTLMSGARSPIELDVGDEGLGNFVKTYFIHAPGHAWGRIQLDHRTGGERTLVLERAGDLEVALGNYRPESKAVLRLRKPVDLKSEKARALVAAVLKHLGKPADEAPPPIAELRKGALELMKAEGLSDELAGTLEDLDQSGRPVLEMAPAADGPTAIAGLSSGIYELVVEIGPWFKQPVSLGQTSVEVRAAEKAQAFVALKDPPVPASPVPLEGTLAIHPGWGRPAFRLTIFGDGVNEDGERGYRSIERSRMKPEKGKPGLWRWSAGRVLPGPYRLQVSGLGYQREIEVGSAGAKDIRIEIGEPADVVVRAVDAETGEEAGVGSIQWSIKVDDRFGGSSEDVQKGAGDSRFAFKAPVGEIVLSVHDERYGWTNETLRIQPGLNEHTLRLERVCGFQILLRDGEATIPFDGIGRKVEAKRTDGPGELNGLATSGTSFRVMVSAPGLYKVTLPTIDGYEPISPQEITVKPGEFVDLIVKLVRK